MKNFKDIIQLADDDDIIKSYRVNDVLITFKARQFKYLLADNAIEQLKYIIDDKHVHILNSYADSDNVPTIVGTLKKINNNIVSVSFKYMCTDCEETGEVDCEECDGTGEDKCMECGSTINCDECGGYGVIECSKCAENPHDESDILFYTEINLNQYELF